MISEMGFLERVTWRGFWRVLEGRLKKVLEDGVGGERRVEEEVGLAERVPAAAEAVEAAIGAEEIY